MRDAIRWHLIASTKRYNAATRHDGIEDISTVRFEGFFLFYFTYHHLFLFC